MTQELSAKEAACPTGQILTTSNYNGLQQQHFVLINGISWLFDNLAFDSDGHMRITEGLMEKDEGAGIIYDRQQGADETPSQGLQTISKIRI